MRGCFPLLIASNPTVANFFDCRYFRYRLFLRYLVNVNRSFLFLLCFAAAFNVYSSENIWRVNGAPGTYPSPTAACQAYLKKVNDERAPGLTHYTLGPISKIGPTQYECPLYFNGAHQPGVGSIAKRPVEFVCPPDYDDSNGECTPPPQDCSGVSPGIFKSPAGPVINSGGRNYVASGFGSETACYNGCSYSISSFSQSCYFEPGSTNSGFCNYIGTGNGDTCNAPDAALGQTGDALNPPNTPDVPPSDPNDPGCPPGYGWSGTTCAKNPDDNGNPGGGDDGGGGDTGGNDGGNNGGANSGGGNNGGGDGSGDGNGSGNGDGSGSGDGSGNGSGSGSGNGSGSGSGNGNGSGDGDGDGDGGDGFGGYGSGKSLCESVECEFVDPRYFGGAEVVPGFEDSLSYVYSGIMDSPIGSAVTNISFPSGSGVCPAGSVQLFGQSIAFNGHCSFWADISGIFTALMLAVWCLLAVRIVLSA